MTTPQAAFGEHAVELRDVRKSFGKTEIIRGTSLAVKAGERVAIIGPNGAGKSTLFNLISGYITPTSGEVLLRDQVISGLPPYQINRRGLSRSFQVTNIFPRLSVWENVRCAVLWSLGYRYAFWRFLADLKDYDRMNAVYRSYDWGSPPPVRTTTAAAGVPGNSLIEIDVIAYI